MAAASSPVVQAIDKRSIHQICSGQVILSIATAMKELVENSLDAGATNIDIKLKNHGADVLEVNDNGAGVEPHNFEALTLKHHTSKLKDFSDLASVETFGFRGEALSSLCALSKLSIVTHHSTQAAATRLEYDHNGKLLSKTLCARDLGTSVSLENLFSTLPVRHREFLRNIKREFTKLVHVLQAYCLISTGVRIACSDQLEKGKKTTVVSTNGSKQVKDNITCVFGPKQMYDCKVGGSFLGPVIALFPWTRNFTPCHLSPPTCTNLWWQHITVQAQVVQRVNSTIHQVQTLMSFQQHKPSDEDCSELGIDASKLSAQEDLFQISGYISKPEHGMGRSSADRQFFFINKRPCDLMKVSRLVNEVYHMYNRNQYPFVMLDISLARDGVDVNVTPDKRQVFVQNEKALLVTIRTSLKKMFDPSTASFNINQKPLMQIKLPVDSFALKTRVDPFEDEIQHQQNNICTETKEENKVVKPCVSFTSVLSDERKSKFPSLSGFKRKFSSIEEKSTCKFKEPRSKQAKLTSIFGKDKKALCQAEKDSAIPNDGFSCNDRHLQNLETGAKKGGQCGNDIKVNSIETNNTDVEVIELTEMDKTDVDVIELRETKNAKEQDFDFQSDESALKLQKQVKIVESRSQPSQTNSLKTALKDRDEDREAKLHETFQLSADLRGDKTTESVIVTPKTHEKSNHVLDIVRNRKEKKVNFCLEKLKRPVKKPNKEMIKETEARLFRAKIAPDSNSSAENELRRNICKEAFERMEILGQFNLGFIIAKLDNDLFIIDQHASDEKFNFEDQQRRMTIKSQRLIIPQKLELTAANEAILTDNVEIFRMNGFEFEIDHNAQAMNKIKLVSLPISKNWTFGTEDIEELIFMLSDSPGVMCRPSRVRKMFASRACRMSVMIGTALNQAQMKRIVSHMGEIDHPWNCPHGRPTMRHLINLGMLPTAET